MVKRRFRRARSYYHRVRRRASGMTIPVAAVAGLAATPAVQGCFNEIMVGNYTAALNNLGAIAGLSPSTHQFDLNTLKQNVIPLAAGLLVHKYVGGKLGVNAALGKARVPLLRV